MNRGLLDGVTVGRESPSPQGRPPLVSFTQAVSRQGTAALVEPWGTMLFASNNITNVAPVAGTGLIGLTYIPAEWQISRWSTFLNSVTGATALDFVIYDAEDGLPGKLVQHSILGCSAAGTVSRFADIQVPYSGWYWAGFISGIGSLIGQWNVTNGTHPMNGQAITRCVDAVSQGFPALSIIGMPSHFVAGRPPTDLSRVPLSLTSSGYCLTGSVQCPVISLFTA